MIYAAIIALLWLLKAERHVMTWLTINLFAMLGVAGAMDLGYVDRENATVLMMLVDLGTGAALAFGPGLSKLVAVGYAITVPLYSLELIFGVSVNTTVAIVLAVAFAQLGVVGFGTFGGGGGRRNRNRRARSHRPLVIPTGNQMRVGPSNEMAARARLTD